MRADISRDTLIARCADREFIDVGMVGNYVELAVRCDGGDICAIRKYLRMAHEAKLRR